MSELVMVQLRADGSSAFPPVREGDTHDHLRLTGCFAKTTRRCVYRDGRWRRASLARSAA